MKYPLLPLVLFGFILLSTSSYGIVEVHSTKTIHTEYQESTTERKVVEKPFPSKKKEGKLSLKEKIGLLVLNKIIKRQQAATYTDEEVKKSARKAIIFGALGIAIPLLAIPAIILGSRANERVKQSGGKEKHPRQKRLASTAVTLGIIGTVLLGLLLIVSAIIILIATAF